jgi:uncharacterized membrane protein YheB (UPF0754 family)
MVPLVSAIAGVIIALVIGKIIMNRIPPLLQSITINAGPRLFPMDNIRSKISDKNNLQNIMPLIEGHIDNFLRHKLVKSMPMIGMFIGDKTISELKTIFLKELEELFPLVMEKYIDDLSGNLDLQALISQKISSVTPREWRSVIKISMRKELALIPVTGFLAGLLLGLVQIALLFFLI